MAKHYSCNCGVHDAKRNDGFGVRYNRLHIPLSFNKLFVVHVSDVVPEVFGHSDPGVGPGKQISH